MGTVAMGTVAMGTVAMGMVAMVAMVAMASPDLAALVLAQGVALSTAAAISVLPADGTGAIANASAAGTVAAGPASPSGDKAADRALPGVAASGRTKGWAATSAVRVAARDDASAVPGATVARAVAPAPASPAADNTVDGATLGVAAGALLRVAALLSSVGSTLDDRAGAPPVAGVALLRAFSPPAPA